MRAVMNRRTFAECEEVLTAELSVALVVRVGGQGRNLASFFAESYNTPYFVQSE